jgi:hypothetical protein
MKSSKMSTLALLLAFAGCLFGIAAAAKVLASDRFASARLWGAARLETLPPVAPEGAPVMPIRPAGYDGAGVG